MNYLKAERLRLNIKAADFAKVGGVSVKVQSDYETGNTEPKVSYLRAIHEYFGADIFYIVTGKRMYEAMQRDEAIMLDLYREAPEAMKHFVLAKLLTGEAPSEDKSSKTNETNTNIHVKDNSGHIISGDMTIDKSQKRVRKHKTVKQRVKGNNNITIAGDNKSHD